MVKKLIKYDLQSYIRLLIPVHLVVLGMALINRLLQIFDFLPKMMYTPLFVSSCGLLGLSFVVCLVMTVVVAIVRFYQGMYSSEGYLYHTLPVTATQHIFAKLLTSVMFIFLGLATCIVGLFIATLGDVGVELFKAAGYIIKRSLISDGPHIFLHMLEALIALFVVACTMLLLFYFCISIGQLAKRKKILAAFGVFFGFYALNQFFSMTTIIFLQIFNYELIDRIYQWITNNQILVYHILFLSTIIIYGVVSVVLLLIIRRIMSRRLNLS